jgi:DNA-binding NarL/FixJ family response regulator
MSTCVVYDDRRQARELLGRMFASVPGISQVIRVSSADELIVLFTGRPGQVAVVGTQRAVPSGIQAIRRVVAARPGGAVVAVGARDDAPSARAAVAAGARGYVGWDASPTVTRSLVQALIGNGSSPGPAAGGPAGPHARRHLTATPGLEDANDVVVDRAVQERLGMSERELEVLTAISHGLSVAEIGRDLRLSDNTVKSHIRRLFVKLGVHERAHAVARAYRSGLFACPGGVPYVR